MNRRPDFQPHGGKRLCRLSEKPTISADADVSQCRLGRYTEIAAGARLEQVTLGDYSYVMERCDIVHAEIGKFVNIASDVRINPGNHPVDWVSQHHFLYRKAHYGFADEDDASFFSWRRLQGVSIGHDVWLGHRAIVMPGVHIGNGAVVGAAAVVTGHVPPYAIVAGVPARPIRSRFPESVWQCIEKTAWWNWEHDVLAERIDDFRDVRRFLERYGGDR